MNPNDFVMWWLWLVPEHDFGNTVDVITACDSFYLYQDMKVKPNVTFDSITKKLVTL